MIDDLRNFWKNTIFPVFVLKWGGSVLLKFHLIFIRQRTIPPTFCSAMIVQVWCQWMTLIKLNWCNNPAFQLIVLCIFILSNPTSPCTWSIVPYKVPRFCLKARGLSQWAKWLWSAPNIPNWAIAAVTNRKFLRITPQASPEYFCRRCHRSLVFLLTPYRSNLDLLICFKRHR